MLYSFSRSFQALQADIASISFLAKSAVDPKFCTLFIDLFTSIMYMYPMEIRNLLAKQLELFYGDINKKEMVKWDYKQTKNFNKEKYLNLIRNLMWICTVQI